MRTTCILAFIFLLKVTAFSKAQDSIEIERSMIEAVKLQEAFKPRKSLAILNKLIPKTKKIYGLESKKTAHLYYHIANAKLDLAEYDEAKKLLDEALLIFKLIDSVSIELGDTYMLIGVYYDYMANYDKALAYYELTKLMYLKLYPPDDIKFGYLYNNIWAFAFISKVILNEHWLFLISLLL